MNPPENNNNNTSTNNNNITKEKIARKRWGLLKRAIIYKTSIETQNPVSKRRFEYYRDIINIYKLVSINSLKLNVDICVGAKTYQVMLHREADRDGIEKLSDLCHFDRTGRISIWPSSQVLTFWCLKNLNYFEDKNVIELGCGFHALPGLSLSIFSKAQEVVLSDGDFNNIEEVSKSLLLNDRETKKTSVRVLRWDEQITSLKHKFHYIIAADVVYNDSKYVHLINTVSKLLKPNGKFFLFNPSRLTKLQEFLSLAQESQEFSKIELCQDYDDFITDLSNKLKATHPYYEPDIHYPLLAILQKV